MNGLMNGWMDVTKNTKAHKVRAGAGAGHLSDHCLCLLFWCQSLFFWFYFGPVVLEKRRGCLENPADMKTVRYCFVTFFLNFPFKPPTLNPLLSSTSFSVKPLQKLLVRHKVLFLRVFFSIRLETV